MGECELVTSQFVRLPPIFTSIHSPKGLLLSAALLASGLGVDAVEAMLGWMTVGQSFVLCPIQPHSMHIDDMPSYYTGCDKAPMRTLEMRGASRSIWMQSLAK